MTSPHRRRRPGEGITGASTANNDNNPSVGACDTEGEPVAASRPHYRPHPARCGHGTVRHRHCSRCTRGRRAVGREMGELCRGLEPGAIMTGPSTFGLDPDALRGHALDLWREGWSPDEVEAVLAVERRSA